jgi:hypothetical protein
MGYEALTYTVVVEARVGKPTITVESFLRMVGA